MVWFKINTKKIQKEKDKKSLLENQYLSVETSFGSKHSKLDCWPKVDKTGIWIRLSVGYNCNYENIIKGLDEVITKLR